jgi:selenocysteine lyase/cysteine desulfurase
MSPLLKTVEKAGIRAVRRKRNPALLTAGHFFDDCDKLRAVFASLIHVQDPGRIAIIPSASYGLANVANNLKLSPGDEILIVADQFPSNDYPWERLCRKAGCSIRVVQPPANGENRGKLWNERILENISGRTKAVAIAQVHWADGTIFDLEAIRKQATSTGALLIIDGTQSIGAFPFDVTRINPDAVICAGYKWLLGPYGIGLAYYGEAFDDGIPIEENWINRMHSEDFSRLVQYQPSYQPGALRYDVGEHSNFILVPMLLRALQQISRWDVDQIQSYCGSINEKAITKLREQGHWVEEKDYRSGHLFGVRLVNRDIDKLKMRLSKERIYVSFRGDAIRVSPHVYNREVDMDRLARVLLMP